MKIPGVYVEIKGDVTQLRKDMKEASSIVSASAKDISNSLNNALGTDKISGQISKMVTNLGTLSRSSKVTGAAFDSLGVDLGELTRLTGMTATQFSSLQTRLLQTQAAKAQESALRSIATAAGLTESEIRSLGQQFGMTNAQIDKASGVTRSAGSSFDFFGGAIKTALAYLGVQQIIEFGREVLNTGLQVDSLQRSFTAITGSEQGMRSEMEFLRSTADATGQNMYALAESYKQLTAATQDTSMEGAKTRDLFVAMSEAGAVLGLSTEKMELSLKAFAQMASKGTVSMEELRGQLGDHLPGALNIAANAMGVTQAELQAMIKEGKVLAEDLLPAMASELHNMYSEAAQTASLESGQAAINRLSQAWTDFKNNLYDNEKAVAGINTVTAAIKAMNAVLDYEPMKLETKLEIDTIDKQIQSLESSLSRMNTSFTKGNDEKKAAIKEQIALLEAQKVVIEETVNASTDSWAAAAQKEISISNAKNAEILAEKQAHFQQEYNTYQNLIDKEAEARQKAYEEEQKRSAKAAEQNVKDQEKAEQAKLDAAIKGSEARVKAADDEAAKKTAADEEHLANAIAAIEQRVAAEEAAAAALSSAYTDIYAELSDSSLKYAELSLQASLATIDGQIEGYRRMGVDEDTLRDIRAEKEKQLYQDWLTEHGSFVDGFKVGIQEMVEEIPTIGEMGKETFGILSDSWKDGFYATITGDMDSLSDVWDSMLSSLLRMFSDFVAELLLKWAAAEFLNINIGVNGGSISSGAATLGSLASFFTGEDSSSQSVSGSENASYYASGGSSLGQQGSGMLRTGAGYLGMGVGAYGVYSGVSNIADGNYGTGALQTGLGAVSMYKGAVAADLLTEGTATEMAQAAWTGVKSYWGSSAGAAAGAEIGTQVGASMAQGVNASYGMGSAAASLAAAEAAASYTGAGAVGGSIEFGASGLGSGAAGGGALAGAGAVGAFLAAVYSLNNMGSDPQIAPTDYMTQTGMSPTVLSQFQSGWSEVENTILDISADSVMMGQAFMDMDTNMLYYTTSLGISAQQWDAATQTWITASAGASLSITDLGASAQGATVLTVEAAAAIISSYTNQSLTMEEAVTVANDASRAYQGLSASERETTGYSIELQMKLMDMGLSATDAASASWQLMNQLDAEANSATGAKTSTQSLSEAMDITNASSSTLNGTVMGLYDSTGNLIVQFDSASATVEETTDMMTGAANGFQLVGKEAENATSSMTDSSMGFGSVAENSDFATSALGGLSTTISTVSSSIQTLSGSFTGFVNSASSATESLRAMDFTGTESYDTTGSRAMGGPIGNVVGFANGGLLRGGSGVRDDLYLGTIGGTRYMAMGGEMVMNKRATRENYEMLDGLNKGKSSANSSAGTTVIHNHFYVDGKEIATSIMPAVDAHVTAQSKRGVLGKRTAY